MDFGIALHQRNIIHLRDLRVTNNSTTRILHITTLQFSIYRSILCKLKFKYPASDCNPKPSSSLWIYFFQFQRRPKIFRVTEKKLQGHLFTKTDCVFFSGNKRSLSLQSSGNYYIEKTICRKYRVVDNERSCHDEKK